MDAIIPITLILAMLFSLSVCDFAIRQLSHSQPDNDAKRSALLSLCLRLERRYFS